MVSAPPVRKLSMWSTEMYESRRIFSELFSEYIRVRGHRGVPAWSVHVIEPWNQQQRSISTNGIARATIVVHAIRLGNIQTCSAIYFPHMFKGIQRNGLLFLRQVCPYILDFRLERKKFFYKCKFLLFKKKIGAGYHFECLQNLAGRNVFDGWMVVKRVFCVRHRLVKCAYKFNTINGRCWPSG